MTTMKFSDAPIGSILSRKDMRGTIRKVSNLPALSQAEQELHVNAMTIAYFASGGAHLIDPPEFKALCNGEWVLPPEGLDDDVIQPGDATTVDIELEFDIVEEVPNAEVL